MPDDQPASTSRAVLVNLTTHKVGGALQAATSLVLHALDDPDTQRWVFAISSAVDDELTKFDVATDRAPFHVFKETPARHLSAQRQLRTLERQMRADLVFTLFGPAYVRFQAPHLCGIADPWLTHSNRLAFGTLGNHGAQLKKVASIAWKAAWFRQADHWWTETEMSKRGLVRRLRFKPDLISVIPNTVGPHFIGATPVQRHSPAERLSVLCLSAYYPHKNLQILPNIALEMQRFAPALDFEIVTTIPHSHPTLPAFFEQARRLGVSHRLRNIGLVSVAEVPELYANSHVSFLPSVLETFSAVYAESLTAGVPLVITDTAFAREICGDAATYFRPLDARDGARAILELVNSPALVDQLTLRGKDVAMGLPSSQERWDMQRSLMIKMCDQQTP